MIDEMKTNSKKVKDTVVEEVKATSEEVKDCLLYTSPSPRDS